MNNCPPVRLPDRSGCLVPAVLFIGGLALIAAGCASPPSVMPLLHATERTLVQEAKHLAGDAEREAQWLAQTRRSLEQAYEADLSQVDALTVEWVRDATRVYVLAREELARHEAHLHEQRRVRTENLHAAADAVRRAGSILQQHDRLWLDLVGFDAWSLLASDVERTP